MVAKYRQQQQYQSYEASCKEEGRCSQATVGANVTGSRPTKHDTSTKPDAAPTIDTVTKTDAAPTVDAPTKSDASPTVDAPTKQDGATQVDSSTKPDLATRLEAPDGLAGGLLPLNTDQMVIVFYSMHLSLWNTLKIVVTFFYNYFD